MKYLGIDYGAKKMGVAISDETASMAFPYSVIAGSKDKIKEIMSICEKEKINEIVMGESKNFDMMENPIMDDIRQFSDELKKGGMVVHFEPEFMSSIQAQKFQGQNELTDASAAAIILQSYLDRINNQK